MPNIKSAKKRVKVTKVKAMRNKDSMSALKTALKTANSAITSNSADKDAAVLEAISKIDKAAAKGLLHKNCAARKKATLAKAAR